MDLELAAEAEGPRAADAPANVAPVTIAPVTIAPANVALANVALANVAPSRTALDRLAALVLLSGSVRPTGLLEQIGRCVLDLPVKRDTSLLEWWSGQARELGGKLGRSALEVRVLHVPHAPLPKARGVNVTVECDGDRYRGTAGALRDLCTRFPDDDFVLVAHAGQVLTQPLASLAMRLGEANADVALYAGHDGTPAGLYLIRCGALRCVAADGYCDLKEQALPRIAKEQSVKIVRQSEPVGLPLRGLGDVINAIRHLHGDAGAIQSPLDRLDGGQQSHFSICERGSRVDATAFVCDSVVLSGAVVQAGAVVARSVVCPGAVVYRNTAVLERVLTAGRTADGGWRELLSELRDQTPGLTLPESAELSSGRALGSV